jgi:hypothetical protein
MTYGRKKEINGKKENKETDSYAPRRSQFTSVPVIGAVTCDIGIYMYGWRITLSAFYAEVIRIADQPCCG